MHKQYFPKTLLGILIRRSPCQTVYSCTKAIQKWSFTVSRWAPSWSPSSAAVREGWMRVRHERSYQQMGAVPWFSRECQLRQIQLKHWIYINCIMHKAPIVWVNVDRYIILLVIFLIFNHYLKQFSQLEASWGVHQ